MHAKSVLAYKAEFLKFGYENSKTFAIKLSFIMNCLYWLFYVDGIDFKLIYIEIVTTYKALAKRIGNKFLGSQTFFLVRYDHKAKKFKRLFCLAKVMSSFLQKNCLQYYMRCFLSVYSIKLKLCFLIYIV